MKINSPPFIPCDSCAYSVLSMEKISEHANIMGKQLPKSMLYFHNQKNLPLLHQPFEFTFINLQN